MSGEVAPHVRALRRSWKFAAICQFVHDFRAVLRLKSLAPSELEQCLAFPNDSRLVAELHMRILGHTPDKKNDFFTSTWERHVRAYLESVQKQLRAVEDGDEVGGSSVDLPYRGWRGNPLADTPYAQLPINERLNILHFLCERRVMESEELREHMRLSNEESFRCAPLGTDSEGHIYWYFGDDCYLFRESPVDHPFTRNLLTSKPAKPTVKESPSGRKGKAKKEPPQSPDTTATATGTGTATADADANDPHDEDLTSTWETVSTTLQEMEAFVSQLASCKSRVDKELAVVLSQDILPPLRASVEARERSARKQQQWESMPRRASDRVLMLTAKREEEERREKERKMEEARRELEERRKRGEERQRSSLDRPTRLHERDLDDPGLSREERYMRRKLEETVSRSEAIPDVRLEDGRVITLKVTITAKQKEFQTVDEESFERKAKRRKLQQSTLAKEPTSADPSVEAVQPDAVVVVPPAVNVSAESTDAQAEEHVHMEQQQTSMGEGHKGETEKEELKEHGVTASSEAVEANSDGSPEGKETVATTVDGESTAMEVEEAEASDADDEYVFAGIPELVADVKDIEEYLKDIYDEADWAAVAQVKAEERAEEERLRQAMETEALQRLAKVRATSAASTVPKPRAAAKEKDKPVRRTPSSKKTAPLVTVAHSQVSTPHAVTGVHSSVLQQQQQYYQQQQQRQQQQLTAQHLQALQHQQQLHQQQQRQQRQQAFFQQALQHSQLDPRQSPLHVGPYASTPAAGSSYRVGSGGGSSHPALPYSLLQQVPNQHPASLLSNVSATPSLTSLYAGANLYRQSFHPSTPSQQQYSQPSMQVGNGSVTALQQRLDTAAAPHGYGPSTAISPFGLGQPSRSAGSSLPATTGASQPYVSGYSALSLDPQLSAQLPTPVHSALQSSLSTHLAGPNSGSTKG